jgi:O-antigen ligase
MTLGVMTVLAGASLGAAVIGSPGLAFLGLLGILASVLCIIRPVFGVLIIVSATAAIFGKDSITFGGYTPVDLLFFILLALIARRIVRERDLSFARTPFDVPLVFFVAAGLLSVGVAVVQSGVSFFQSLWFLRPITYYLLFFVVTFLIRDRKQARVLAAGLFVVACATSVAAIVQAVLGNAVDIIGGRVEGTALVSKPEAWRVIPPGEYLAFIMLLGALSVLVLSSSRHILRSPYFWAVILLSSQILLTYFRALWVAVLFGAGLILMLGRGRGGRQFLGMVAWSGGMATIAVGIVILYGVQTGGMMEDMVDAVSDRFESMFGGEKLVHSGSLEYRSLEAEYAIRAIAAHPILGVGLGAKYRDNKMYGELGEEDPLQAYIHVAYLSVPVHMGIVGFLPLALIYWRLVGRFLSCCREIKPSNLSALATGLVIGNLCLLLVALLHSVFEALESVVAIAVTLGLSEVIWRIEMAKPSKVG